MRDLLKGKLSFTGFEEGEGLQVKELWEPGTEHRPVPQQQGPRGLVLQPQGHDSVNNLNEPSRGLRAPHQHSLAETLILFL